jgi:hypothetical protein
MVCAYMLFTGQARVIDEFLYILYYSWEGKWKKKKNLK